LGKGNCGNLYDPYTLLSDGIDSLLGATSKNMASILQIRPVRAEVTLMPNSGDPELHRFPNPFCSVALNNPSPGRYPG
jgi:hypothetical protein